MAWWSDRLAPQGNSRKLADALVALALAVGRHAIIVSGEKSGKSGNDIQVLTKSVGIKRVAVPKTGL
jgi:hypothetical protein